jgi:hypothetical protein
MCLSICLYILQLCSLSVCSGLSINICNHTYHTHIYLRSSEPTHHLPLAHSHTIFDAQCVWFLNVWVCVLFKSVCVCAIHSHLFSHTWNTRCHFIPLVLHFNFWIEEASTSTTTYILL